MKILFIILQSYLWIFSPPDNISSKDYQTNESYVVQLIEFNTASPHHPLLSGLSSIMSDHCEYYIADKKQIINALRQDSLDIEKLQMIIEPSPSVHILDENGNYRSLIVNYSSRISGILQLDDTEIYKIGKYYYVLRRIKYAYLDKINLKYFDYSESELKDFSRNSLFLFLFTKELLPTHSSIQKYMWKRKYQLSEFWQGRVLNKTNKYKN